jgi:hypothetical protein
MATSIRYWCSYNLPWQCVCCVGDEVQCVSYFVYFAYLEPPLAFAAVRCSFAYLGGQGHHLGSMGPQATYSKVCSGCTCYRGACRASGQLEYSCLLGLHEFFREHFFLRTGRSLNTSFVVSNSGSCGPAFVALPPMSILSLTLVQNFGCRLQSRYWKRAGARTVLMNLGPMRPRFIPGPKIHRVIQAKNVISDALISLVDMT